jgi:hypothetical protein
MSEGSDLDAVAQETQEPVACEVTFLSKNTTILYTLCLIFVRNDYIKKVAFS